MIQVSHLSFSYTANPFIQDMSFSVDKGEIFGFLGPSGAGKSTLQRILLGMLPHYQGSARVNGVECKHHGADFYASIGVDFEFSTLYEKLSARENLQFFSSLYRRQARSIPELLAMVGLENDADKRVSAYSKGMKSRLNFVKALLHDPALLFLDEPTSGLDPTNSRLMKDMILEEKRRGKTILLTTHFMEEAERLCDELCVIDNGRKIAQGKPHELIAREIGCDVVEVYGDDLSALRTLLEPLAERVETSGETLFCYARDPQPLVAALRTQTETHTMPGLRYLHRPANLEDVFLRLTGREMRD